MTRNLKSVEEVEGLITIMSNLNNDYVSISPSELVLIGASQTVGIEDLLSLIIKQANKDCKIHFTSTYRNNQNINTSFLINDDSIYNNDFFSFSILNKQSLMGFIIDIVHQVETLSLQVLIVEGVEYINDGYIKDFYYALKLIATKYEIAVFVRVGIKKRCEARGGEMRPRLSDIKNGSLKVDLADKAIFSYRYDRFGFTEDESGDSVINRLDLIVAKNNSKEIGTILYQLEK